MSLDSLKTKNSYVVHQILEKVFFFLNSIYFGSLSSNGCRFLLGHCFYFYACSAIELHFYFSSVMIVFSVNMFILLKAREEELASKRKDMEVLRKSKQLPKTEQVANIQADMEKVRGLISVFQV